ncbi:DUF4352 domain-containing protein (plasmid) [Enterococcus sp. 22-H-5-01]|uniref:DUF4352 domain-containing protein n=1 Tax=Enterococcus sp. 22-H-5-01 TaxID=3418555 RepID=UPI003CFDAE2D
MKKIIGALSCLFVVAFIAGCSTSNEAETEESSSSYNIDDEFEEAKQQVAAEEAYEPDSEDVSDKSSSSKVAASIGQSQPFTSESGDMIDVKIDSVEKDMGDGDYYVPENGYYAKVNFTVTNLGDSPFEVTAHQLDFYDGQNMKAELNSRDFYSDTIQPGKSATGVAYFDVKNDTPPNYEVYFADASWTGSY